MLSLLATTTVLQAQSTGAGIKNGSFQIGSSRWWYVGSGIAAEGVNGEQTIVVHNGFVVQEHIPVNGGHSYRMSMDVRTTEAPWESVYVQMSFRGPGVQNGWSGPLDVGVSDEIDGKCEHSELVATRPEKAVFVTGGGNNNWLHQSLVFSPPKGATELVLYLRKANCTPGSSDFRNISLEATDDFPTTPAEALRQSLVLERLAKVAVPAAANSVRLSRQLALLDDHTRQHQLALGGKMQMAVHAGADEDLLTLKAAVDLSDYYAKAVGQTQAGEISTDSVVSELPLLVVGRKNAFAEHAFTDADFEGLGDDGFLIRSLGPDIMIAGKSPRGTMYGVNWFLDHRLGIRWLSPSVTYIPHAPDVVLPAQNERQIPRFSYREVLSVEAQDKVWRQHNLMNGESHGPSFLPSPPAIDSWNRTWQSKGTYANFFELLPPKIYGSQHPDWYAGGQLAMMNKEMRSEMARAIIARLKLIPHYEDVWFAVHDMDWGWDMDPASQAFANQHGGHASAPRLHMMIDVANQVRRSLPGARLAFNAYHWSFTPPEGMIVPDYILVYPMTVQVNYRDPLNGPANAGLKADLVGWTKIARHVLVWDHITNFGGFIQPTPNILQIGHSLQWLATLPSIEGYMGEGSWNTPGAEFAPLRAWVIARLLWNPTDDPDALIAEFCDKYYGPASGPIRDYIRYYEAKIAASTDVLAEKTTVDMAMFDDDFVRRTQKYFDDAEKAATGTAYMPRVRAARMPVDYVLLLRRAEYSRDAASIGFDVMADLSGRLERFWETVRAERVSQYLQGGTISELRSLIAVERKPASTPGIAAPSDSWKDIQDISFQRFAGLQSSIVADPLASDGAAVSLDRQSTGWNAQLKLDKLPANGKWWLYAALRSQGGSDGEAVVKLGSAPPMNCYTVVKNSSALSGAYVWFAVPGGPFTYSSDHERSIYLQPIKGVKGSKILIDRIFALSRPANAELFNGAEQKCQ